ncbi:hypothetical protein H2202_001723 [Exophiala xenobiotica]|nr:hypothetical protein H2202_001723 [Exophiala xenobiotica]
MLNTLKIDIDTNQTPPLLLYSRSLEHVRTFENWLQRVADSELAVNHCIESFIQLAFEQQSKQSKMRKSLHSGFGDPLEDFKILIAVRQISSATDSEFAALEDRIRKISHSSDEQIGDEPARTARYIDQDADG